MAQHPHYNMQNRNPTPSGFWVVVGILAAIIWFSSICFSKRNGRGSPNTPIAPTEQQIYVMAELAIKSQLKSPASAKFPAYPEKIENRNGADGYIVMSYVDAQNSFGANLRNYWICQLIYKGGEWDNPDNWVIVEAKLM